MADAAGADAKGAFVMVDGQTYRVLGKTLEDVKGAIDGALEKGAVLSLDVAAVHNRAEGMGSGTLYLHGAQLSAVAVLSGPQSAGGMPIGF